VAALSGSGADLVARIRSGEPAAEAEMVSRFGPGVAAVLRRAAGAAMSEDLYQDAFRIALQRIRAGEVQQPERLGGFLCGVARHLALEHYRRQSRLRKEESLPGDVLIGPAPSPLDQLLDEEKVTLVRQVIGELETDRDRQLLLRFYLGEEDKAVLCRDLDLTPQHFNRVLFRARQRYRELYERRVRSTPRREPLQAAAGVHSSRGPSVGLSRPEEH
jgi:RNA polymerase sigma-70 factor, ECF subfamily